MGSSVKSSGHFRCSETNRFLLDTPPPAFPSSICFQCKFVISVLFVNVRDESLENIADRISMAIWWIGNNGCTQQKMRLTVRIELKFVRVTIARRRFIFIHCWCVKDNTVSQLPNQQLNNKTTFDYIQMSCSNENLVYSKYYITAAEMNLSMCLVASTKMRTKNATGTME